MADHVDELIEMVRSAGGTMRLYGREVKTADELRAGAEASFASRVADAMARAEMWPSTLASNLATAGALCEAFWEGWEQREHHDLYSAHGYRLDGCWSPGCGQPIASLRANDGEPHPNTAKAG